MEGPDTPEDFLRLLLLLLQDREVLAKSRPEAADAACCPDMVVIITCSGPLDPCLMSDTLNCETVTKHHNTNCLKPFLVCVTSDNVLPDNSSQISPRKVPNIPADCASP